MIKSLLLPALLFCATFSAVADQVTIPQMTETDGEREDRLKWFRDAKFGLFIHWGPAAVSGEEISWGMMDRIEKGDHHKVVPRERYMNLYKEFNPVKFDADAILSLAKNAGMKYMVFVTKHHDGFSMWDTKEKRFPVNGNYPEHFSISDTPYQKDILKEVQAATLKHGLKLGWYYSTRDWTHPEYLQGDNQVYNDYYENQVEELLEHYGPVDLLWYDHCFGNWDQYTIPRLFKKMYSHNPKLLVNNRVARGLPDIPTEYQPLASVDYDTPENRMGAFQHGRAWESCMILSPHPDHGGWSYRHGANTRSLKETIKLLSSCVTGDGNMLLNIAPLPDGSLKPEEQAILEGIAPWIQKYGEAVYGTRGGPWINGDWGGSTYRENHVYLHLFDTSKPISLNTLPEGVQSVTTIDGKPVDYTLKGSSLTVSVPKEAQDKHVSILKVTLDAPVSGVLYGPALSNQSESKIPGTITLTPDKSTVKGNTLTVKGEGTEAILTQWTNPKDSASWDIAVDSPGKYKIQITASCEGSGSVLTAHFGKGVKGSHGLIPVTGSAKNYQTFTLGNTYFPNAEKITLTLKPGHPHAWKAINLQSMKLIPVN